MLTQNFIFDYDLGAFKGQNSLTENSETPYFNDSILHQ